MAAEYAFYDACDMGSQEACDHLSGAGAGTDTAPTKPKEEAPAEEPGPKKKAALPPEALKAPPKLPGLKKSEIQEAIREHLPEVKYCFQKSPAESGQMAVTVWIDVDVKGKVENVGIKYSNVDKTVEECVLQSVRRITFPVPPDGQPMKLSYPFTYVP
jgi:TonB family protein